MEPDKKETTLAEKALIYGRHMPAILTAILAVVLLGGLLWINNDYSKMQKQEQEKVFAIYMRNTDMIFGKAKCSAGLCEVTNVRFLVKGESGLSLQKLTDSIYGASDKLVMERSAILWINELSETSEVAKQIRGLN